MQEKKHYRPLLNLIAKECNISAKDIYDFEINLVDATNPCFFGIDEEFISA